MLEVQKSHKKIGFRVLGELVKQLYDWEYSIDEMVFKEQLATGSFKGNLSVKGFILETMQQAEREGKLLPYYGPINSGACVYKFRLKGSKCNLRIEHSLTGDSLDLEVGIKKVNILFQMIREPAIQFSFLPYVMHEELSHPWIRKREPTLVCKIAGQEYQTLTQWKNWMNEQALTPRYIYQFAQVSLKATGFAIKVEDTETGEIIDPTNYDDW